MKQTENIQTCLDSIGALISARRRSRYSQGALADKVGLSRDVMANLERGRQEVFADQLWDIARALECALSDLLPEPSSIGLADVKPLSPAGLFDREMVLIDLLAAYASEDEGIYLPPREHKAPRREP